MAAFVVAVMPALHGLSDDTSRRTGRGFSGVADGPAEPGNRGDDHAVDPGAEHRFSNSARQDKPVNADTSRLYWPQALAFIDLTTA